MENEAEKWAAIKGYEDLYEISNRGRVKSLSREVKRVTNDNYTTKERILKAGLMSTKYYSVSLYRDNTKKTHLVHRLVANAFIPKVEGRTFINHKDLDKTNNRIWNLEWITNSENIKHAWRSGACDGNADSSKRKIINDCTGEQFGSIKDAAEKYKTSIANICHALRGRTKKSVGFKWRYADEV